MNPSEIKGESWNISRETLDEIEIEDVKITSEAFAMRFVNELFDTIKSENPVLLKRLNFTRQYPYYLHIFIHQEIPGIIDSLEMYSEPKTKGDDTCEVRSVFHSSEFYSSRMEKEKQKLAKKCIKRGWTSLDVSKMPKISIWEGKRAAKSILNHTSLFSWQSILKELAEDIEKIENPKRYKKQ